MVKQIDQMLEPGERVVFRTRLSWRNYFTNLALLGAYLLVFFVAVIEGAAWLGLPSHGSLYFILLLQIPLLLLLSGGRSEAVVTDRRLLYRSSEFWWRVQSTPHDSITAIQLHGLWRTRAITVGAGPVTCVEIAVLPDLDPLARALAETAGLPAPREPGNPSIAERAARVLNLATAMGLVPGIIALVLALLPWVDFTDPGWLNIVADLLLITFVVPIFAGMALGWFVASLLALAYLRPMVSAPEMQEAIELAFDTQDGLTIGLRHWARPIFMRLTHLFYGQAVDRPQKEATSHG